MSVYEERLQGYRYRTYNFLKVIGKGSFATVYEAFDESTCNTVAIKAISMQHFKNPKIKELTEGQIKIMKACRNNPNIIKFIDTFKTDRSVLIVMEYCEEGSLKDYVKKRPNKRLTEDKATYFLKQIINGFKGLHEKRIIHRDFKSQNVLLHGGNAKIADLGFAKMLSHDAEVTRTQLGTALTMAPEVHKGQSYGLKADLWSLGVVYYQLIYGFYPYEGKDQYQIYQKSKKPPSFSGVNISANAKDFILKCLTFNQHERIPWSQVYSHPLITGKETLAYGLQAKAIDFNEYTQFYKAQEGYEKELLKPEMKKIEFTYKNDPKNEVKPPFKEFSVEESLNFQEQKGEKLSPVKLQKMKMQNNKKKQIQSQNQMVKQMYLNRRNNIMFVYKYIIPYVQLLSNLPVIHANYLFILCKYTYYELKQLRDAVKNRDNIYKIGEHFFEFVNSTFYKNLQETLEIDTDIAAIEAAQFGEKIKNPDKQLGREKDIFDTIVHPKWQTYVKNWAQEYQNILMTCMSQADQHKHKLIIIIEALEHFINMEQNQDFEMFDCRLEHMNFQDAEMGINSRYEYKISKIKF